MSFPRYPNYKESGVDWLGAVPGNWVVTALKRGFDVTLGKMLQPESNSTDDELLPYLRAANIQWGGVDSSDIKQMWFSNRDRVQLRLENGDLLVSEGGDVGRSCLWAEELESCYFQNSVNRVRARDGHSNRYLYYWMSTIKDKGYIDVLCNKSTIAHFTAEKVAAVPVPLPTTDEQTQIAAFLDRETAKIDELVAEQRRLMELLKEKRQAVISHAVTQGLNPHAPMKPSGIEWLGDVPTHWAVLKCSSIGTLFGSEQVPEESVCDEGDLPFIKVGSMSLNSFEIESWDWFVDRAVADHYKPRSSYIVFPKRGAAIFTNKVNIVERPSLIDPNLMGWEIGEKATPKFIAYTLKSRKIEELADVSTVPQINNKHIAPERFPVPPLGEQHEIVAFVDDETTKFDTLTAEAQRAIDLLQERRTALISAAVTGQIDVRRHLSLA